MARVITVETTAVIAVGATCTVTVEVVGVVAINMARVITVEATAVIAVGVTCTVAVEVAGVVATGPLYPIRVVTFAARSAVLHSAVVSTGRLRRFLRPLVALRIDSVVEVAHRATDVLGNRVAVRTHLMKNLTNAFVRFTECGDLSVAQRYRAIPPDF
jgi:hypothetical protein